LKIAVLGGTGDLGRGLVLRWSNIHDIVVGSRRDEKAKALADEYRGIAEKYYGEEMKGSIKGFENLHAASESEIMVLTIPHEFAYDFVETLKPVVTPNKIIVSPIVPIQKVENRFTYTPYMLGEPPRPTSAAEMAAQKLNTNRVVSAFHAVAAEKLAQLELELNYDIPIAGDDSEAVKIVSNLITEIPNLRPLYAGPLAVSSLLESLTPLLLNLIVHGKIKHPSLKII